MKLFIYLLFIYLSIYTIYYFNILEDRKNNTEKYQEIVSILGDNLQRDDEGNLKVFVPNVSFVVNGKIIGNDYETSLDTKGFEKPSDYWTEEEVNEKLREKLVSAFDTIYNLSQNRKIDMRLAAYIVGIKRTAEAARYRGWA